MKSSNLKKTVNAALMAAMTCIATMVIKFPTPTFGYIHLGDGFVLLCGAVLGPLTGGLAAGIGSMFSDIFSGYASFAPATLIIKALTAGAAGFLFHRMKRLRTEKGSSLCFLLSGIVGEILMILGYFISEAALAAFGSGSFTGAALAAGIVSSAAGIPFNAVQGVAGIVIGLLLLPILKKIPDIREWVAATRY